MKKTAEVLDEMLYDLYYDYALAVLDLWWEDPDDRWLEANIFWVEFWDIMFSLDEMRRILHHNISKDTCYDFKDMQTWGFYSLRVREAIDLNPRFTSYNLYSFNSYFNPMTKEEKTKIKKEWKKKIKEIKKELRASVDSYLLKTNVLS